MKKRLINILLILLFVVPCCIIFVIGIPLPCMFKQVCGIPCPSCGITRALNAILEFDILGSFKYNILALPLFIFAIISVIYLIRDLIDGSDRYINSVTNFFKKYYIFIFLLLAISFILNIVREI